MNAMKAANPSAGDSELSHQGLDDLEKVQAFIQEADQNQNNSIDYREFIAAQARRQLFQNPKKQDKNFNMIVQSFNFFDVNDDGVIDIADPIAALGYLFSGDPVDCLDAVDANDDGALDIADPIYKLDFLFSSGPPPPPPHPAPGVDPTPDSIDC